MDGLDSVMEFLGKKKMPTVTLSFRIGIDELDKTLQNGHEATIQIKGKKFKLKCIEPKEDKTQKKLLDN